MGVISAVIDLAPAYEKPTGHVVVVRCEQAAAHAQSEPFRIAAAPPILVV
jgi:hypothetical protein